MYPECFPDELYSPNVRMTLASAAKITPIGQMSEKVSFSPLVTFGLSVYFYPKDTMYHITEAELAFHLLLCTSSRFFLTLTDHFQCCVSLVAMQNEASR